MAKRNGTHDLDVTVQCPACHEYGVFHTWDVIDTADAKMSERVHFDENLFFYTCPHCHAKIHMESKCLYIDRDKKLLVWHIPDPKERVTSKEVQDALGSPSFTTYTCRAALTWGEWREKIIELESAYDDRLYEIIKYGAYQLLSQEDKERLPAQSAKCGCGISGPLSFCGDGGVRFRKVLAGIRRAGGREGTAYTCCGAGTFQPCGGY